MWFNFIPVKLNANRQVAGVLRGFDPFMNLVLDETVEKIKDGVVNSIGMVVCYIILFLQIKLILFIFNKLYIYRL